MKYLLAIILLVGLLAHAAPPAGYKLCELSDNVCVLTEPVTAVYGADDTWSAPLPFTNSFACQPRVWSAKPQPGAACWVKPIGTPYGVANSGAAVPILLVRGTGRVVGPSTASIAPATACTCLDLQLQVNGRLYCSYVGGIPDYDKEGYLWKVAACAPR